MFTREYYNFDWNRRRKNIQRLSEEESEWRTAEKKKAFTLHRSYVDYVMGYRLYFL